MLREQRKKTLSPKRNYLMAMLRAAVATGYKDAEHMKKDKDLDPLRQREDFKKQLAELQAGKAKEKK